MKLRSFPVKTIVPVLAIFASFAVGCGKQFEAVDTAVALRPPPATSDPMSAADQRRWEATQDNEPVVETALPSDFERGAFLQDVTEEKPKYTEQQLAEDAERVFEKHKDLQRPALPANPEDASEAEEKTPPAQPPQKHEGVVTKLITKLVDKLAPKPKPILPAPEPAPVPVPQPAPQVPPTHAPFKPNPGQQQAPEAPPGPLQAPPQSAPSTVPHTKPQRPAISLRSEFCEKLNVTSAKAKTDLGSLYNSTLQLADKMPSAELSAAATSQDKKNRFVCSLLPSAIRMNEEVYRQRIEILRLQAKENKGTALSKEDQDWLADMRKAYLVNNRTYEELLKRVDIIPLPLLLAQAAIETAWGTSRATIDLNNLFGIHAVLGQKCKTGYDTKNACMRVFESAPRSVSAYIQLLNAGTHYPGFRDLRAKMRKEGESLDSEKLLATIGVFNEKPTAYIRNVREIMMGSNKLTQFAFEEDAVDIKAGRP